MYITKENVTKVFHIIEKATLCTDWATHVRNEMTKTYDDKQEVPKYLMSFYDMSGGHDYCYKDERATKIPWLQKQITEGRIDALKQRITLYKDSTEVAITPNEGVRDLEDGKHLIMEEDINMADYYDVITENATWSMTSIFMHRCIRVVEKGYAEDNKYCLWPLCQPWVNHRPVGVKFIDEFVKTMKMNKGIYWEGQSGASVPYCVDEKKEGSTDSIQLEFMINSGESATNANEYVKGTEVNLPAGPVCCVGCDETELDKCYFVLTVSRKGNPTEKNLAATLTLNSHHNDRVTSATK
jgi:hypothetical protein